MSENRKKKMQLTTAIQSSAQSNADAQNAYLQNVIAVNTLMNSVLSSQLPTPSVKPPDWTDYCNAYEQANNDALYWVNTVMSRLLNVPDSVKGFNTIISALLTDAQSQSETLINAPDNNVALSMLNTDLTEISKELALVTQFLTGAISALENFSGKLPDMASQLQTIAIDSAQDAQADQEQIDTLKNSIAQLQSDISSLTASIVALGIADAAAVTLGAVAAVAAWPVGTLTWLFLGPAVLVSSTYIALDSAKITADKAQISQDQEKITGLTASVATLQLLADNYAQMAAQTQVIEENMNTILAQWQILENDVNAAITDTQEAISDSSSAKFNEVNMDMSAAILEWNAAYSQACTLTITINVNNAQLEPGMSSDEVQTAMNGATTTDVISYFNNVNVVQGASV